MVVKSDMAASKRFDAGSNVLTTLGNLTEDARSIVLIRTQWPLCRKCARSRRLRFSLFLVMLCAGLSLLVATIMLRATGGASAGLGLPFYSGLGLVAGSIVPFVFGSLRRLTKTYAAKDGTALVVEDPHPAFARAVEQSVD